MFSNHANNFGGAIYSQGNITLVSTKIMTNTAGEQGGGIWCAQNISTKKTKIVGNEILIPDAGNGGSAIFCDNGNCIIDSSIISNNKVIYNPTTMIGGSAAILVMNGLLTIYGSQVNNNSALNSAGIQMGIGNISIERSTINGNKSFALYPGGGGITITLGTVHISHSEICDNKTLGMYSGGLVSLVGDGAINNSKIMRNVNNGPGGGLAFNIGTLSINESIISDNIGASLGGGIVNFFPSPGSITINNSEISNNILTNGQTIKQTIEQFLAVVKDNMTSTSQQATKSGGLGGNKFIKNIPDILSKFTGVHNILKDLSIALDNSIGGGAIATLLPTYVVVNDCEIKNNFAGKKVSDTNFPFDSFGGGIFSHGSDLSIINSIIKKNITLNSGGGIYSTSNLSIEHSKINKNSAIKGEGGGLFNKGKATLISSEIKKNRSLINGSGIENKDRLELISCDISHNKPKNSQVHPNNFIKVETIV